MVFIKFLKSCRAATMVEYTILIGLLTFLVIMIIWLVSQNIEDRFANLRDALSIEPAAGSASDGSSCAQGSQGQGDENCTAAATSSGEATAN